MTRQVCVFGVLFAVMLLACTGSAGAWQMKQATLMTDWASQVDPNNPWPEYPRPQMTRADWRNLNGIWQYKHGYSSDAVPIGQNLGGEILVPFAIESAISGVMQHFDRVWYRRTFTIPGNWTGQRIMLNFGAVDWESEVYINGHSMGIHQGGYDPFSYDITPYLNPGGIQELIVRVYDPTDSGNQPRGKQVNNPGGIFYTATTGIWQTVWLEPVPTTSISSLKIVPDIDNNRLKLTVNASGPTTGVTVSATALDGTTAVGSVTGATGTELYISIPSPKLWSPTSPFLYNLNVSLVSGSTTVDSVQSYFGMRKIVKALSGGINKILLNNQFTFLIGPLDQGFWPDGCYIAPTDAALAWDLQIEKQLGFNCVRKHVKVEPLRWYYWADRLGLLVFQDMPSGNSTTDAEKSQFELELSNMIQTHWNSPSIGMWIVFNEGWGQYDTTRLTNWVKATDPSRLAECASGWTDYEVGDAIDYHAYPNPACPTSSTRVRVNGEYGGIGYAVTGHMWNPNSWSYTMVSGPEEWDDLYGQYTSTEVGNFKNNNGLSAAIYTQITDCETEINGLVTYDRKVIKPLLQGIYNANHFSYTPIYSYQDVVPVAQSWKYTTTTPATNWYTSSFDDATWTTGTAGFGQGVGSPHTAWTTTDIWIRRTFNPGNLTADQLANLVLKVFHDEDADIYINGVLACTASGYNTSYQYFNLTTAGRNAILNNTNNLMAIHCKQTGGGQFIDAGLTVRIRTSSTYTLTPSAPAGGTISPCNPILVLSGGSQTFNITPNTGYAVSGVQVDGINVGAVSSYTFSGVSASHTISPTFTFVGPVYTIWASAGVGGSISPSGSVAVNVDSGQTFTATPNTGYIVSDIAVDGISQGPVTSFRFNNVSANHTISVSFAVAPTFTITATAGPNGSISPSGNVLVTSGADQTFTINANTGYAVSSVTVDGANVGAVSSYIFGSVSANHTISATFAPYSGPTPLALYQFENNVNDTQGAYNGTAYNSPTYVTGKIGSKAIQFNGTNQYVSITRPVSDSFTIAFWVKTTQTSRTGTNWYNGNGLIDGEVGGVTNDFGITYLNSKVAFGVGNPDTTLQSTSLINTGNWVHVACTRSSATGQMKIYINGALETTGAGPTGTKSSPNSLHFGNIQTNGNYFSGAIDQVRIYDSILSASDIVSLANEGTTFTITASAGSNGSISPSGSVIVNYGAGQTFTITPSAGYAIADVLVDGVSQGAITTYIFNYVTGAHAISATFDRPVGISNRWALTESKLHDKPVRVWGKVKSINGTTSFVITDGYNPTGITITTNGVSLPTNFDTTKTAIVTGILKSDKTIQAREIRAVP